MTPHVVETLRWLIANKNKDANHFAAYAAEVVRLGQELLERALASPLEGNKDERQRLVARLADAEQYIAANLSPELEETFLVLRAAQAALKQQPRKATPEMV